MLFPSFVRKTILSPGLLVLLAGLLVGGLTSPAHAQSTRPGNVFYGKLGGGISDYTGDFPPRQVGAPLDLQAFTQGSGLPFVGAGELGYQFSPRWALALGFQGGNYPITEYSGGQSGISDTYRYTPQLLGRYTFAGGSVAPYVDVGVNATFGGNRPPTNPGVGPSMGGGLDILLSRTVSFYVESRFNLTFPNEAVDGAESGDPFDLTGQLLGFGLKVNFAAPTPPRIVRLDGPTTVTTDTSVTFAATINERADRPLDSQWDFGDGGAGSGLTATHTYEQPGTYEVSFSASNEAGTASRSITVTAKRPPKPAQITSVTAVPNPVDARSPVQFLSAAEGSGALTYEWSFGDGSSATGQSPIHTYTTRGEYAARLRVSNEAGTDVRTVTVRVTHPARKNEADQKQADSSEERQRQTEEQPGQKQPNQKQEDRWGIVVASTRAESTAKTMVQRYRDRFSAASMPVSTVEAETDLGLRYRVVVGEFEDKEAARQAIREYEEGLPPMEWILRLDERGAL